MIVHHFFQHSGKIEQKIGSIFEVVLRIVTSEVFMTQKVAFRNFSLAKNVEKVCHSGSLFRIIIIIPLQMDAPWLCHFYHTP